MKREIFNNYVLKIIDLYRISKEDFFTKTKKRACVDARHFVYYLCHKRNVRIRYIQDYMEENGYEITHSSVIHGISKMSKEVEKDGDYLPVIEKLNQENYV
ncbi:MAG: hypothetical protein GOVbin1678_56 [Prokaryotic dsDNA virus sp.]|jgi:chromosomal replication initiation ATPase DnaA|nr:MAG: hypothetical protein GOVbin1678_56 [Prokaryotic dsDNA virus sp.]|tara:strand:+ start:27818 stop:28120 length:303 start_codon:yes stop_codon:yes gene_type:complete